LFPNLPTNGTNNQNTNSLSNQHINYFTDDKINNPNANQLNIPLSHPPTMPPTDTALTNKITNPAATKQHPIPSTLKKIKLGALSKST
jgi:hypothetical protein